MKIKLVSKIGFAILSIAAISFGLSSTSAENVKNDDPILFDFEDPAQLEQVQAADVELSFTGEILSKKLMAKSGHNIDWPGLTFTPKGTSWDGSKFQKLSIDIENIGSNSIEMGLRIDNPGGDGTKNSVTQMSHIAPGSLQTLTCDLYTTPWTFTSPVKIEGMHSAPGQKLLDPKNITKIILFIRQPSGDHQFTIDNVRFETPMKQMDAKTFFPFVDKYGQFKHDDWPGKIYSNKELLAQVDEELDDLAKHPGPKGRNQYGGWKDGPKLKATGYFRVQKHEDKWWFVDPDGYLFWSHGIDSVSSSFAGTGTQDREKYFEELPEKNSELGSFYYLSNWAPYGFYHSRNPHRSYNFLIANLYRKYGHNWHTRFSEMGHQRLKSWGMNTMASWSDPKIYRQQKTPYAEFIRIEGAPFIAGSKGHWQQFVDVFDPSFRDAVKESILKRKDSIGDPWCIGFYIDNELSWGYDDTELGLGAAQSPASQKAKQVFVDDLEMKYKTVAALNKTWGSEFKSWKAVLNSQEAPHRGKAAADLRDFTKRIAETYFTTINEEMKNAAPNQLYFGCRFMWLNDIAVRAAAQNCDVVSFNRYNYSVEALKLPEGEDKPILIGEFHFGALDRGMFHPTKVPATNQKHRGQLYKEFIEGALRNKAVIGTHWFQYTTQPLTGRGDGENYQVGFVDICDTPYQETIDACRDVGYRMYEFRLTTKP